MHELGIVFHVIKMVEEVGEKNSLTSVARVGLALGEVSGVLRSEERRVGKECLA